MDRIYFTFTTPNGTWTHGSDLATGLRWRYCYKLVTFADALSGMVEVLRLSRRVY